MSCKTSDTFCSSTHLQILKIPHFTIKIATEKRFPELCAHYLFLLVVKNLNYFNIMVTYALVYIYIYLVFLLFKNCTKNRKKEL